tara:strand:- start:886 stop:1002 length:117 start_codon:yes stop_codon:yes gene_type:complete
LIILLSQVVAVVELDKIVDQVVMVLEVVAEELVVYLLL